jgi:hypothetical protein
LTINVDSAKLKNLMRELYVESLNTEIIEWFILRRSVTKTF